MKQSRRYLFLAITGLILVILVAISFIDAYRLSKNFRVFMFGVQLFIAIVYTINYTLMYRKEQQKNKGKKGSLESK
jgi:tellurite resistance protein TehA-like permease